MPRAIITGVSSGLGLALAGVLRREGNQVLGISRRRPDLDLDFCQADLRDSDDVERVVYDIRNKYSDFFVLVINAGMLDVHELKDITRQQIEDVFATNVFPAIQIVSGLFDLIAKQGADIVLVGSTAAFKTVDRQLVYGASKWSLRGIAEGFQREFASTSCRVIGFHPGGFRSDLYRRATGSALDSSETWMNADELAELLYVILRLPKSMEVSQIVINRKGSV